MNSLKNKNASKLSWIKSAFSGWLVAAGAGVWSKTEIRQQVASATKSLLASIIPSIFSRISHAKGISRRCLRNMPPGEESFFRRNSHVVVKSPIV